MPPKPSHLRLRHQLRPLTLQLPLKIHQGSWQQKPKPHNSLASRMLAPTVVDTTLLRPDSKVERPSDGNIYVTTAGTKEKISKMLYQIFLKQNLKRVASSSIPTALASQMEEDEEEPIEWGDMDPSFARMLQSTPSMLQAYKALRSPKKMAKLDTSLGSFQPSTNVTLPELSPSITLPDSVTLDNIKETIQSHETTVQPSFDIFNKQIRQEVISRLERSELRNFLGSQTLNAIESEQQRQSVIIYNIPLFSNMSSISQNMTYLLKQSGLSNEDVQSASNHLHTSTSLFSVSYFCKKAPVRLSFKDSTKA